MGFSWLLHARRLGQRGLPALRVMYFSNVRMGVIQKRKALGQFQDKAEVTIYDRKLKDTHYSWAPWVAGGQMLIWLNFADFYWRYSMDKNEETGELTLAPMWKRAGITGIALVAGVSIGGGLLHFVSRSVARLNIVDRGAAAVFESYRISGRGVKKNKYPISTLFSRDTLYTGKGSQGVKKEGSPQYSLYPKEGAFPYIMNREGVFQDPKTLDLLFHKTYARKS
ncbi:hypothetical protein H4S08_004235 [Coemansia sp. RSA 1365]|nr:hypothetical protein H4S08_004235 [Coemansia sp. RSA 1365]